MLPFGSSSFGQLEGSQDYAAAPSQLPCFVFLASRIAGLRRSPFTTAFLFDHKASEDAEARCVESSEVESSEVESS